MELDIQLICPATVPPLFRRQESDAMSPDERYTAPSLVRLLEFHNVPCNQPTGGGHDAFAFTSSSSAGLWRPHAKGSCVGVPDGHWKLGGVHAVSHKVERAAIGKILGGTVRLQGEQDASLRNRSFGLPND